MARVKIFDTVRAMLKRGFTTAEVRQLDAAIDEAFAAAGAEPSMPGLMRTSERGINFIHSFESLRLKAYPDPGSGGDPWTIGWGSTTDFDGKSIKPGTVWTRKQADDRFAKDLQVFENGVNKLIAGAPTTQSQFDAMVSFAYNLGLDIDEDKIAEGLGDSTLLKHHIAGRYDSAASEFVKWNKAAGKVMNGLTRRRLAEADIYRGN